MATPKKINEFGLVDTSILNTVREQQRRQMRRDMLLQTESGVTRGGTAIGLALGEALRRGVAKTGFLKDKEAEEAEAVTSAQRRAQSVLDGTPDELKSTDVFGSAIQQRQILVQELEAAGLDTQADTVRQQIISLRDKEAKFAKLQGERRLQEIEIADAEFESEARRAGVRENDEIVRLLNQQQRLDLTDPAQAAQFDVLGRRIDKLASKTGQTEFDVPFDEVTVRAVDKNLMANTAALDGFLLARNEFDPKFLELGSKVKNFAVKAADIAGLDLPEDVKQDFREFMVFRQVTSTNLNAYIKAITGAQMSNPEAIRLANDVPTLDDSPEQYMAKLENVITRLTAVRERSLSALSVQDDPREFRRIMSTPLTEFQEKAKNAEQSDEARAAEDALARLQAQLNPGG